MRVRLRTPERLNPAAHAMAVNPTSTAAPHSRLPNSLSQKKIPSLDGLRAVAVALVICNHLKVPYAPEGRGVLTFFVLSGFLITWMMLNESENNDGISVRNFYVRRVLRIFPAFYVFLALSFGALLLTRGWPSGSMLGDYLSAFSYTSNYRFALMPHMDHACWHTWAVSIEEQFYLLWPWFFVAFQQDLRKLTHLLIAAIVLVDVYRIVLFFKFHVNENWLHYSFDSRVDHLLVGCLLAVLIKRGVLMRFWNFLTARTWISLVSFGLIVLSIAMDFRFHVAYKYAVGFVVDPLLTAIFLVQVIAMGNTWLWGWLNWRVIRYLGQVSYGMFLYHMLVNRLVIDVFGRHSLWIHVPAVIAGAALLGAFSFHLIERRFLRLKSRFMGGPARKPVAAVPQGYQLAGS
jgi:peptidoglycan/LPS O-acetylase OafA/YrhL